MTNLEKIQKAIELMNEVKESTRDNELIQAFINDSIERLKGVARWINK